MTGPVRINFLSPTMRSCFYVQGLVNIMSSPSLHDFRHTDKSRNTIHVHIISLHAGQECLNKETDLGQT